MRADLSSCHADRLKAHLPTDIEADCILIAATRDLLMPRLLSGQLELKTN